VKVNVVCFGAMRDFLPAGTVGNRAAVEVAEGARVGDLIAALGAPVTLVHAVLVDGSHEGAERVLHDGAEVTLMPPFTGGATL
jgi:molybdopterin converting factor small subunit